MGTLHGGTLERECHRHQFGDAPLIVDNQDPPILHVHGASSEFTLTIVNGVPVDSLRTRSASPKIMTPSPSRKGITMQFETARAIGAPSDDNGGT